MNQIVTLEGRRLNNKMMEGWLSDNYEHARRADAEHGSLMLKNAILRAKGYHVPEPQVVVQVAPEPPVFKERIKKRVGRPKGSFRGSKARHHDPLAAEILALVAAHFKI